MKIKVYVLVVTQVPKYIHAQAIGKKRPTRFVLEQFKPFGAANKDRASFTLQLQYMPCVYLFV